MTFQKYVLLNQLFLMAFVFMSCQNNNAFKIVPIEGDNIVFATNGDTAASKAGRFDNFIVEGNFNEKDIKQALEDYAYTYADSLKGKYMTYGMTFYKESGDINVKDMTAIEIKHRWKIFAHGKPFYEIEWLNGKRIK